MMFFKSGRGDFISRQSMLRQRTFVFSALAGFGILLFWLAGQWPGYFAYDTFKNLSQIHRGMLFDRSSYIYPPILGFFSLFSPDLGWLGVFQAAAIATAFSYFCWWPYVQTGKSRFCFVWAIFAVTYFFINPFNDILSLAYTRSVFYSWLVVLFLLSSFLFFWRRGFEKPVPILAALAFSIVAGIIMALRQEAVIFLFAIAALLLINKRWTLAHRLRLVSIISGTALIFLFILPKALGVRQDNGRYSIGAVYNPLSYILFHDRELVLDPDEKSAINAVISESDIIKHHDDSHMELGAYDKNIIPDDLQTETYHKFIRASFSIFAKRPYLFFKNRCLVFMGALGLSRHVQYYADELSKDFGGHPNDVFYNYYRQKLNHIARKPLSETFFHIQNSIVQRISSPEWLAIRVLLTNSAAALLLTVFNLLCIRRLPLTGILSALMLMQTFVIFMTAPSVYFLYLYSLHLYGFFLPAFMYLEWRVPRSPAPAQMPAR